MRAVVKAVAMLATLVMVLAASPAVAGKGKARVGGVDPSTSSVRIDKVKGSSWKRVDRRTKVVTVDRKGRRTVRDAGQLTRGAKVLGTKVRQGRLKVVRLAARGATGNTDCSFDTDEDDDDRVDDDRSFTCEHDYDDGEVETESDCEVESESESKVPILGDIPLLGFFFRQGDVQLENFTAGLAVHLHIHGVFPH